MPSGLLINRVEDPFHSIASFFVPTKTIFSFLIAIASAQDLLSSIVQTGAIKIRSAEC